MAGGEGLAVDDGGIFAGIVGAYAITSGLKHAFSAFGRLTRSVARIVPRTEMVDLSQYLPGFAELLDLDD